MSDLYPALGEDQSSQPESIEPVNPDLDNNDAETGATEDEQPLADDAPAPDNAE